MYFVAPSLPMDMEKRHGTMWLAKLIPCPLYLGLLPLLSPAPRLVQTTKKYTKHVSNASVEPIQGFISLLCGVEQTSN